MFSLLAQISWLQFVVAVFAILVSIIVHRLYLSPLSAFPGPKLAALTRYYEIYYDLVQNGQYTFKIAELHKQYGPIIRISPYELHVSDPTFFDTLYRNDKHYDKYKFATSAFGAPGGTMITAEHHLHKARRQPLSPFFSKAKVAGQQELIHRHMNRLFRRIEQEYVTSAGVFEFGAAVTAFVRDVTNEYVLGKSYNSLGKEDFDMAQLLASQGAGAMWRLTKFLWFVAPIIQSLPPAWMLKVAEGPMKEFLLFLQETQEDTKKLISAVNTEDKDPNSRSTIVHEIMKSDLPPSDKQWHRVFQDVSIVSGAGYETTASILRMICFHIFSNEQILHRLRAELTAAGVTSDNAMDWKVLEQLPYLTAIINEGMRLSPGIATRMARVAHDEDIAYKKYRIPAGTAVGMTLILMHTDEATYPDPLCFNPSRWIDEEGVLIRNKVGFAPFSKGTRICLGMNLAWAEMYIFLAHLVQRFDLRFPSAVAEDFHCVSDQFAIATRGQGRLQAVASFHQGQE